MCTFKAEKKENAKAVDGTFRFNFTLYFDIFK